MEIAQVSQGGTTYWRVFGSGIQDQYFNTQEEANAYVQSFSSTTPDTTTTTQTTFTTTSLNDLIANVSTGTTIAGETTYAPGYTYPINSNDPLWSLFVSAQSYKLRRSQSSNPLTSAEEDAALAQYGNTQQLYDYLIRATQEKEQFGSVQSTSQQITSPEYSNTNPFISLTGVQNATPEQIKAQNLQGTPIPGQPISPEAQQIVDQQSSGNYQFQSQSSSTQQGSVAGTATVQPPTKNLQPGQSGPEVSQLQQWLMSQGYSIPSLQNRSAQPGYFGPETQAALSKWQTDHGVDTMGNPGFFGPRTMAAIQSGQNQGLGMQQQNAPTSPTQESTTRSLIDEYAVKELDFKAILEQIKTVFGFDDSAKEIQDLDNKLAEEVNDINDNPWISEGLRVKKVQNVQSKFESKRDALVNKLRLEQDIVGKALDVYQKEKDFQRDLFLKQLDMRSKKLDEDFTLSPGSVRFDAEGNIIASVPRSAGGTDLPSSYEEFLLAQRDPMFAKFLGERKTATAAQETVATYAARIEQANPFLLKLTPVISKMSPVLFEAQKKLPSYLQSSEFQQYDQASRNFINAVLRRESGAVISPSEFDNAYKQYLPRAGDSLQTLQQKEANRNLVFNSFKKSAGSAFSSVDELLGGNSVMSELDSDIQTIGEGLGNREILIQELMKDYPNLTESEIAGRVYTLIPDK